MKKIIFGIFAHPDDEAFGPAATLLMEKAAGNEVHLICATAGKNGVNLDNVEDLSKVRLLEWHTAGELIGADSMHHLDYCDGCLQNQDFHEIAQKITDIVTATLSNYPKDIHVEFMSMDLNGITGHLDHIMMGRVACYVFYNLKKNDIRFTRIRLICVPKEQLPDSNCNWLYMDAGRSPEEIDEVIDGREYTDTVIKIIRTHHSQRHDGDSQITRLGDNVAINHFMVLE